LTKISPQVVDAGKTDQVDVLAGLLNPCPQIGPLQLVSASIDPAGAAGLDWSKTGQIKLTAPSPATVHNATVTYQVNDALGQADRVVQGSFTLAVQGVPEAPTAPQLGTIGQGTIDLSWTAPANNGAAIDTYEVDATGGLTQSCPATTCTIKGVNMGTSYSFRVKAHNQVGWSALSAASRSQAIDLAPSMIGGGAGGAGGLALKSADQGFTATWSPPDNQGSAIERYELQYRTADGEATGQTRTTTNTQITITGLTNGTKYQARVRADNKTTQ
jgi:hypothetical protein